MPYKSNIKSIMKCPLGHIQSDTDYHGFLQCDTGPHRIRICSICGMAFDINKWGKDENLSNSKNP